MAQQEGQNGGSEKASPAVTFTAANPLLVLDAPNASEAVKFYRAAFGAVETSRTTQPKRKAEQDVPHIISAELQMAGTTFLVSDLADNSVSVKGSGVSFVLVTENVEGAVDRAVAAGAVLEGEIGDGLDYGAERVGKLKDPYGFVWIISSPPKKSDDDVEA